MRARWQFWKAIARAYGMWSEELALEIATQALSRTFLDTDRGPEVVSVIQGVLERNAPLDIFCAACDAMTEMDLSGDLPKIQAPTLVTGGDADFLTPLDQGPQGVGSREIAARIPNAELHVFEGVAHTDLMEVPEQAVELAIDFFKRVGRKAAA